MYCPDCKQQLKCGCSTCVRLKTHEDSPGQRMIHLKDTQLEACPNCGVVRENQEWADIEMDQYDELVQKDNLNP